MTTPAKKASVQSLRRKIERLEATIAALQAEREKTQRINNQYLYELVDMQMRIRHAQAMLSGEDL